MQLDLVTVLGVGATGYLAYTAFGKWNTFMVTQGKRDQLQQSDPTGGFNPVVSQQLAVYNGQMADLDKSTKTYVVAAVGVAALTFYLR